MTKVMLLFDSEYQTAINIRYYFLFSLYILLLWTYFRKRLIRQQFVSLETELHFLNTIFTSPLHRHTKSPLLWSHRHFCIQILPSTSLPSITNELTILFSAGDRHPKNYHAWTYARYPLSLPYSQLTSQISISVSFREGGEYEVYYSSCV